jgi:hypothetical protein
MHESFAGLGFASKHRYAFALHTDEPHPHVRLVVKAVSEQGIRLNIRKATLRKWRTEFARHLRDQGIAANATERAVCGETRKRPIDPVYRATLRGDSTYTRARTEAVAAELLKGNLEPERSKSTLLATRKEVERGWRATSDILIAQGHPNLAAHVRRFLDQMPAVSTERESIAQALQKRASNHRAPDQHRVR